MEREKKRKKRELSIKDPGSSLLRKKCLNVIRVRVWPGHNETAVAASRQSSETEKGIVRGQERTGERE